MSSEPTHVTLRILDKEYQVACRDDERAALQESAALLNHKMQEIREAGKVVGLDRIAVMAALNLSYEILQSHNAAGTADEQLLGRLRSLNDRLAGALGTPSSAH